MLDELGDLQLASPVRMADSLCVEYPGTNFFPERGESPGPAKAVSRDYLVRGECLVWAFAVGVNHGVCGGRSQRERVAMRVSGPPLTPWEHEVLLARVAAERPVVVRTIPPCGTSAAYEASPRPR